MVTLVNMTHPESLSKAKLLELLDNKELQLQAKDDQLRQQDMAVQTKELTIEELSEFFNRTIPTEFLAPRRQARKEKF